MLFLMVETFSKDGIKIGLFPTEFIKKSFFEKCPKMDRCLMVLWHIYYFEKFSEPTSFGAIFSSPPLLFLTIVDNLRQGPINSQQMLNTYSKHMKMQPK